MVSLAFEVRCAEINQAYRRLCGNYSGTGLDIPSGWSGGIGIVINYTGCCGTQAGLSITPIIVFPIIVLWGNYHVVALLVYYKW